MRVNKIHTLWIMLLSSAVTAYYGFLAMSARFFGFSTRPWVDKTMLSWASSVLRLVRVKCEVINPYNVHPEPGKPTIVMCIHTSLYDIPISMIGFPTSSLRMLAKKEMSKIPFVGKGMAAAEFPFIDRKNRHHAIKDLKQVHDLLESGIVIWIAPEGTRSKNGKLAAFKKGGFITAIQANATIIPIGIRGAFEILPARTLQFNIGKTAELHIGKPIEASEYTLKNKEELIERTHKAIKELIGETKS